MMRTLLAGLAGASLASLLFLTTAATPVTPPQDAGDPADMAAMMKKMAEMTQPGEHHAFLERFVGDWTTSTSMMGMPGSPGTASFSWLHEGRWLMQEWSGSMMGMQTAGSAIMGYDNMKMSFVVASCSTMDTALHHAEGDLTQHRDALILYGTLDEYLTGEHDKMVRTVWRFPSDDEMVMEIHDLAIGEDNTKVVEITYTRA